jgi:group II intron reverse transcriptase/maturase
MDVIFRKSSSLPDVEMTREPKHATEMENCSSYKNYESLLDKSFMVLPYSVDGAKLNPFDRSTNINIIDSHELDQSSRDTLSITSPPQVGKYTEPNKDIRHKESTTGFPKGSNSYGDGVLILGFRPRVQSKFKVGQRNYSTGPDAVNNGTVNLSKLIKLENGKFTGLYKTLATEEMIRRSYERIKSKPGNMTPGVDKSTLDGFSPDFIDKLIKSLREETFNFKPVKRTFIPKSNGKLRPLGIPSPNDKIIQESMRTLLEIIFEPLFLDSSHGFRSNRSCHTALKQTTTWNGYTWCIEGDIKGFFDNVDHHILEKLLKKYIEDQQFIDLFWKLVRAGYVEKGISYDSNLGVPQGGILSPILSNIYLHELDLYVKKLITELSSDDKSISKVNPKIVKYSEKLTELNSQYQLSKDKEILKKIKDLRLERNQLPSRIRTGIRINYVRYADDWIIGIIGDKQIALLIKDKIARFLLEELKITLSSDKTKISHFKNEKIKFLGVYLTIPRPVQSKIVLRNGQHGKTYSRVNHVRMNYLLPKQIILEKFATEGFLKNYVPGGPIVTNAITKWIFLDHRSIIIKYNSIINGLINYYSFVDNYHELHLLINFILRHSCAKTLARKFRLGSRAGAFKMFGDKLKTKDDKPIGLNIPKSYVKTKKFKVNLNYTDPFKVLTWKLETQVNNWDPCWICGSKDKIEMHHVKHLRKDVNPNQIGFTKLMSDLNRKQIPVCQSCHLKIHKGTYNGLALKDLKRPNKKF